MESSTESRDCAQVPKAPRTVHLLLRDGFHGHTVVITMNDLEVLHAVGIVTDPVSARAGAIAVCVTTGTARFAVSVTPWNLMAALDVDVVAHPHVAISLVGEGTVAFETSAVSFR